MRAALGNAMFVVLPLRQEVYSPNSMVALLSRMTKYFRTQPKNCTPCWYGFTGAKCLVRTHMNEPLAQLKYTVLTVIICLYEDILY